MRNLKEFPITKEEVLAALDTALQQENDDDQIGGVNAFILTRLYDKMEADFDFADFEV